MTLLLFLAKNCLFNFFLFSFYFEGILGLRFFFVKKCLFEGIQRSLSALYAFKPSSFGCANAVPCTPEKTRPDTPVSFRNTTPNLLPDTTPYLFGGYPFRILPRIFSGGVPSGYYPEGGIPSGYYPVPSTRKSFSRYPSGV